MLLVNAINVNTDWRRSFLFLNSLIEVQVSQWYVYPRDMCTPSNMAASDMCIPHPPPLQKLNNYG